MNKQIIKQKANEICENFNHANSDIKLNICTDAKSLAEFYKTYDGIVEFLYIAPEAEIAEAINNGAVYFGVYYKDQLAGVAKCSKLELPYPFFCVPQSMDKTKDYWGLSGLYIHKLYQGKKLSTVLLKASTNLAKECKANGIYADFDYRNVKSMRLVSKYYNMLGYTDGRNGSPDEATIYTTFFKDFSGTEEHKSQLTLDFNNADCDYIRKTIDETMKQIGRSSTYIVAYCDGFNEIVCFDKPYAFESTLIDIKENISKNTNKNLDK